MPAAMSSGEVMTDRPQQSGYRVFVRVRPMSSNELVKQRQVVDVLSPIRLRVVQPYRPLTELKVDRALGPDARQDDVFAAVADVIDGVMQGRSGTILAYGQTGSGKTYMMSGPLCPEGEFAGRPLLTGEERGLIPRVLEDLFEHLSAQAGSWAVRVSFMEVYNEQVYDLLDDAPTLRSLELREGRHGPVEVPGLQVIEVQDVEEALQLLEEGTANRAWGDNGVNATSSRSHALFQVTVENEFGKCAKLSLVDLAGSEKLQPGHGSLNVESTKINLSLTALGQCIAALLDSKRKHVPYRNSKLTRLLQEPLQDASASTVLCVCISPADNSLSETMSSLQFADRAKRVVLQRRDPPYQPQQTAVSPDAAALQRRVEELTAQLEKANEEARHERRERKRLEEMLAAMDFAITEPSLAPPPSARRQVMPMPGELWEHEDARERYTMEEGTSTLQLAFEMAKQGLEDILAVVEVLDHHDVAVSRAKHGLQEIVAAVDTLHCISMEAAEAKSAAAPAANAEVDAETPPLCRSSSASSELSRLSSASHCSHASGSTNTSPNSADRDRRKDGASEGSRRNPVQKLKLEEAAAPMRPVAPQCWVEFDHDLQGGPVLRKQGCRTHAETAGVRRHRG